ncbi:MAG: 4Fe-4S binding protein [Pirellulales bacterium]|nr:4Fe-4S binding protein [Pirellulales bacterium]
MAILALGGFAWGAERFPPPDFSEHKLPPTLAPSSPPLFYEYLDLAALFVGLSLASYFAVFKRSRRGLFILSIVSLLWLGFWREGCICPIGAIQNVALAVCTSNYAIPLTVAAFFALPLIFTIFFGRTFCAAVCPLGAVQELAALKPVRVPLWLDHTLGLLAYIYLGLAVLFSVTGTAFLICRYDPFVGFFRMNAGANMLVLGGCFLLVGIFVGRPYCRYLCPYGAILGLLSRISQWHVKIPPEQCINCRLCEDACPYGAIREPTVPQSPVDRDKSRRRLGLLLFLLPILMVAGYLLGKLLEVPLSRVNQTVRLAEYVRIDQLRKEAETAEPAGLTYEPFAVDAVNAFRNTRRPVTELYQQAVDLRKWFAAAGAWFGAYVGLVIGVKLIHLSLRRRRADYQPDRAGCVACGRCFWYCPEEKRGEGRGERGERFDLVPAQEHGAALD